MVEEHLEEHVKAIFTWVKGLDLEIPCTELTHFQDGLVFKEILTLAAPDVTLSVLKTEGLDNALLRLANMKSVVRDLEHVFLELGGMPEGIHFIDASAVARTGDVEQIVAVLQLCLAAAVQGSNKEHFVPKIMSLEQATQEHLMHVILEVQQNTGQTRKPSECEPFEKKMRRLSTDGRRSSSTVHDSVATMMALQVRVDNAEEEAVQLANQVSALQKELANAHEDLESALESKSSLTRQLNEALEANVSRKRAASVGNKQDAELQEKELRVLELEKQLAQLQRENVELQQLQSVNKRLTDDLDVARTRVDELSAVEAKNKQLREKMGDISKLKKQIDDLEESNQRYLEQQIHFERELDASHSGRELLESAKARENELLEEMELLRVKCEDKDVSMTSLTQRCQRLAADKEASEAVLQSTQTRLRQLQQSYDEQVVAVSASQNVETSGGESLLQEAAGALSPPLTPSIESAVDDQLPPEGRTEEEYQKMRRELNEKRKQALHLQTEHTKLSARNKSLESELSVLKSSAALTKPDGTPVTETEKIAEMTEIIDEMKEAERAMLQELSRLLIEKAAWRDSLNANDLERKQNQATIKDLGQKLEAVLQQQAAAATDGRPSKPKTSGFFGSLLKKKPSTGSTKAEATPPAPDTPAEATPTAEATDTG